jgi:hypothetical protein
VAVALPLWVRAQDDNDRELRNNRLDLRDLEDQLRACCNHGANIRNKLPVNQDFGVGLALSNPKAAVPELIPTTSSVTRPAIGDDATLDYKWPPRTGTYTANGAVSEIGEITRLALALLFQENRAWIEGFTLSSAPSQTALVQIFSAARALSTVLAAQSLSRADYVTAWSKMLGVSVPGTPPTITNVQTANAIASVAAISGHAFNNRAMRLRVTVGGGNYAASTDVATVVFSQPFSMVPAVVGDSNVVLSAVTTSSFTFQLRNGWTNGSTVDVSLLVGV